MPEQPIFRSGVELVTIDVVATGRDGNPVHDLKASDFELFEDGKKQAIRAFQFLNYSMAPPSRRHRRASSPTTSNPAAFSRSFSTNRLLRHRNSRGPARRRTFPDRRHAAHDHVAVVRSGANSGFFDLRSTMAIEPRCRRGCRDRGIRLESAGALDAVGAGDFDTTSPGTWAATVSPPRSGGRKAPVRFPRAARRSSGSAAAARYPRILRGPRDRPAARAQRRRVARLINRARFANVAIYTVDPRGLVAPSTTSRDNPGRGFR